MTKVSIAFYRAQVDGCCRLERCRHCNGFGCVACAQTSDAQGAVVMLTVHTTVAQTGDCWWLGATPVWTYQSNPLSAGPRRSSTLPSRTYSLISGNSAVAPTSSDERASTDLAGSDLEGSINPCCTGRSS
jgi:hypothetical protein